MAPPLFVLRASRSARNLFTIVHKPEVAVGLDTTTPAARMAFGIFASVAEFERERLRERTLLGLDRARTQGKRLGRPVDDELRRRVRQCAGMSVREAAKHAVCSTATVQRVRKALAA
jgi:DNA invertase Pin-like site-specific DNA recombinase